MGQGTMVVKNYRTKRGYYLAHDYDKRFGGKFTFLLLPLFGTNDERFFYVTKNKQGGFTVEGEAYVCTRSESVRSHTQCTKRELAGKSIWYYHINENGDILKKEKSNEVFT